MKLTGLHVMLLSLIFIFLFFSAGFSDDSSSNQVKMLIQTNAFLSEYGLTLLRNTSQGLPQDTRESFYNEFAKNPWLYGGLNLLLPGLGSWMMGDVVGAILIHGGTVGVIVTTLITGSVNYHLSFLVMAAVGVVGFLALEGAGFIIPFIYAGYYNYRLRTGLELQMDSRLYQQYCPYYTLNSGPYPSYPVLYFEVLTVRF